MAKLKIYQFPDIVLSKKATPIARVEKSLYRFADDMLETMYEGPGIGLAANQVGVLDRIMVVDVDFDLEEIPEGAPIPPGAEVIGEFLVRNKQPKIIINPEIIYREGNTVFNEACLSVPEYSAEVKRAEKIKLQYQDIDGLTKTLSADGLLAICLQHELDHLDGKLFIDRLSPLKKEMVKKKLRQKRVRRDAGELESSDFKSERIKTRKERKKGL